MNEQNKVRTFAAPPKTKTRHQTGYHKQIVNPTTNYPKDSHAGPSASGACVPMGSARCPGQASRAGPAVCEVAAMSRKQRRRQRSQVGYIAAIVFFTLATCIFLTTRVTAEITGISQMQQMKAALTTSDIATHEEIRVALLGEAEVCRE